MKFKSVPTTDDLPVSPSAPSVPLDAEVLELELSPKNPVGFIAASAELRTALADLILAQERVKTIKGQMVEQVSATVDAHLDGINIQPHVKIVGKVSIKGVGVDFERGVKRSWDADMIDEIYGSVLPDYIRKNYTVPQAALKKLPERLQLQLSDALVYTPTKLKIK